MVKSAILALFSQAEALEALTMSMPLPTHLLNALTRSIGSMQHLRTLSLRGSRLADAKSAQLCVVLRECRALKSLDLAGCSLTDSGATAVAALVKHRANKCATGACSVYIASSTRYISLFPAQPLGAFVR